MPHRVYASETTMDLDTLLDTLGHHMRRKIIRYFETEPRRNHATRAELLDHLDTHIPTAPRDTLSNHLVHAHLPKLATRGWLDYDTETTQITYHGKQNAAHLLNELDDIF